MRAKRRQYQRRSRVTMREVYARLCLVEDGLSLAVRMISDLQAKVQPRWDLWDRMCEQMNAAASRLNATATKVEAELADSNWKETRRKR